MGTELFFAAVVLLMLFALFDLVVGVSNDAVNFLNSSIGSRVAPYYVIIIIASLGILAGVTFSSGMMEVARKGIFHPQFFTMPELMTIFVVVMLTDILLLDLFNTYGLPTSTTVSIVFELLGAAIGVSLIKISNDTSGVMALGDYINTAKALTIVFGIMLSIVVAFISGAVVQFCTRMLFTFDYEPRLKKYGSLWGGGAMAVITFFILVKGAKGSTLMMPETMLWVKTNYTLILGCIFAFSAVVLQILSSLFKVNTLKMVVIVGTFALAMAFAANDLVNFIGVPLAGLHSYNIAMASDDPLNITMGALSKKVHSEGYLILIAGVVMVFTLWLSKKARTVAETEISLGQQDEGIEKFESIWLSRRIVSMADALICITKNCFPASVLNFVGQRIDVSKKPETDVNDEPAFDLLRAAVNLMVASAVVSFATSLKLPLSTTYVTFMVAMGTSFADKAWGRESAVYRVTGVLTVICGWFMTAVIALSVSFVFANIFSRFEILGVIAVILFVAFIIWKNKKKHEVIVKDKEEEKIFNLKKIKDPIASTASTFDHLAIYLKEVRVSLDNTLDAVFDQDIYRLRQERKKTKKIQGWTNMIMANVFKVLRLLSKEEAISFQYAQTIRRLQKITDGHRDTVLRSTSHVGNKHAGLLDVQVKELEQIKASIMDILEKVEMSFTNKEIVNYQDVTDQYKHMRKLADEFDDLQTERIRDETSKTRLSILYYAIVGNCIMMAKQNIKLLEIFNESFKFDKELSKKYLKMD
ncbi:MAG: inorganic phosphate transporter [Alphaproteobacteria bacterium]|nr:inorganic phosphate transporter [Alphaproteobacteria bacterium]